MAAERFHGYDFVGFDFDGTLARLSVDWEALRSALQARFPDAGAGGGVQALCNRLTKSRGRQVRVELAAIIRDYEQPGGQARVEPIAAAVATARSVGGFFVVSSNLRSTVEQGLAIAGLAESCRGIVGFDDVAFSKPDPDAFAVLTARHGVAGRGVYSGDLPSDAAFASACGLDFIPAGDLCASS